MKAKISLLVCAFFFSQLALAQSDNLPMLGQGTKELALSGNIEIPEFEDIDFDIDMSYGYFLRDGWEIGIRAIGADVAGVERFSFSGFTEYNFNRNSNTVPYIGASVGLTDVDFSNLNFDSTLKPNDDKTTDFALQAGVKWFVRPYMAITTSIGFTVSSEDIYLADNSFHDSLTRFHIGLRYYF